MSRLQRTLPPLGIIFIAALVLGGGDARGSEDGDCGCQALLDECAATLEPARPGDDGQACGGCDQEFEDCAASSRSDCELEECEVAWEDCDATCGDGPDGDVCLDLFDECVAECEAGGSDAGGCDSCDEESEGQCDPDEAGGSAEECEACGRANLAIGPGRA